MSLRSLHFGIVLLCATAAVAEAPSSSLVLLVVFSDGFDSGDLTAWSETAP